MCDLKMTYYIVYSISDWIWQNSNRLLLDKDKLGMVVSGIITVEAGVLALLMPISLDLLSRLSERYQSNQVINRVLKRHEFKFLPYFLIITTGFSVLFGWKTGDSIWPGDIGCLIVIGVLFIVSLGWTWILVQTIRKYSWATSSTLLDELFKDAKKILS
jgi:uncharacterized BrkB/YihY/UPF0761 family membrane protein